MRTTKAAAIPAVRTAHPTGWGDVLAGVRLHDELVLHDRVHPNEAGYRLMAEAVMNCLSV
jgi:lysophospholipase L1-like esterase